MALLCAASPSAQERIDRAIKMYFLNMIRILYSSAIKYLNQNANKQLIKNQVKAASPGWVIFQNLD
jgi:hypothetical protein